MKKKILILGISGQDGCYLADLYLKKKFIVHGTSRMGKKWDKNLKLFKITNKIKIFKLAKNESKINSLLKNNYKYIFFLGGQPKVNNSFDKLEYETFDSQIIPLKVILEFIKFQKFPKSKFMFSSSSEIFGNQKNKRLNENSLKIPQSPYGLSKLIGLEIIKSYREMFKIPVFSIIFFNHESIFREDDFVLKKVSNYLKNLNNKKNYKNKLELGNINIKRDWGFSGEYMSIIYKIMHSKKVSDYVLGTGKSFSLKEIIRLFFKKYKLNYKNYIRINNKFFRKFDINENHADITKIKKDFKFNPRYKIKQIINLF